MPAATRFYFNSDDNYNKDDDDEDDNDDEDRRWTRFQISLVAILMLYNNGYSIRFIEKCLFRIDVHTEVGGFNLLQFSTFSL